MATIAGAQPVPQASNAGMPPLPPEDMALPIRDKMKDDVLYHRDPPAQPNGLYFDPLQEIMQSLRALLQQMQGHGTYPKFPPATRPPFWPPQTRPEPAQLCPHMAFPPVDRGRRVELGPWPGNALPPGPDAKHLPPPPAGKSPSKPPHSELTYEDAVKRELLPAGQAPKPVPSELTYEEAVKRELVPAGQ